MKKIVIYYFSGTGNSYHIAKAIGANTDGTLIPIAKIINEREIISDADKIGIVFPIYYVEMPVIVHRFMEKLKPKQDAYIYIVSTFGGGKGGAKKTAMKILKAKGATLSAFYGVHMPQNAFAKPFDNHRKLIKESKKMIDLISYNQLKKVKGYFYSSYLQNAIQTILYPLLSIMIKISLPKMINAKKDEPLSLTLNRMDKLMKTTANCDNCGICIKVCPVNNIDIVNERVIWKHSCVNCLACYNFCPQKAIRSEIINDGYYYIHPNYSIEDAII